MFQGILAAPLNRHISRAYMEQMELFLFNQVEMIRMRVAAVTKRCQYRAAIASLPKCSRPIGGFQSAFWGDPIFIGTAPKQKQHAERKAETTLQAASVFSLAALGVLPVKLKRTTQGEPRRAGQMIIGIGYSVYRGTSYGAAKEPTEAEIEKERARRARQKPPKPKNRTKSKKLISMIAGAENG